MRDRSERRAGEKGREEREGDRGGIMEDRRGEERRAKSLISSGVDHGAHTPINTHRVGFLLQPLSLRLTPITCTNTVDQQRGLAPHTGLRGREQAAGLFTESGHTRIILCKK